MAIDRIGKGGAVPPEVAGGVAPAAPAAPAAPFKVDKVDRSEATAAAQGNAPADRAGEIDAATPLGRLRAGEVDVHGYVDLKVEEATKNLKGLSPAELADIKSVLRDQMRTDPGLAELVKTATGKMPAPPED